MALLVMDESDSVALEERLNVDEKVLAVQKLWKDE